MLSDENDALCRRDHAIAGLELVLQPAEVLEVIRSRGLSDAQDARLDYLRYKPSRRCIGLFDISWRDSNSSIPNILVATAMTKESWQKFNETRAAMAIKQGAILLPEKRLALEWFPNDHGLRNAAKVMSLASRPKVLRRILQSKQLDSVELNTLAYKPARRHVASGVSEGKMLFTLKTYTNRGFVDADWRVRLALESGLSHCQVLGSSSHYSSLATSWIDGCTLSQWMLSPSGSLSMLQNVGAELASWHTRGQRVISSLPAHKLEPDHPWLRELAEDIAVLAPGLAVRARSLATQLIAGLNQLPQAGDLIHGDFYAKQVILDPSRDRVQFIDFDQLRLGDRYEDIANFVAKNYWQVIHEGLGKQKCEAANQLFLDGYVLQFGPLDRDRLRLFVAIALFRCAPHAFRRALPDWTNCIESLLDLAECWLAKSQLTCSSTSKPNLPSPATGGLSAFLDISQVNAAWTHSRVDMASSLKNSIVTAAKLVRHKPKRRLLVEYIVTQPSQINSPVRVLGKARLSKGLDARTPQLHQQLLSYDWGDSEVAIPQVYGLLPSLGMWLQESVEGDHVYPAAPLSRLVEASAEHARVGGSLADFHRAKTSIDRSYSVTNEITKLGELFADLANSQPELTERLISIELECQRLAESLPSSKYVPIHRDFYFDQVLVSNEHVYLLDLDLAAMGPAELDVGNYLAHLDEYGIRYPSEATNCQEVAEAFLNGYLARSTSICLRAVAIWRHLSLARHIALSARIEGRAHTTLPLLKKVCCTQSVIESTIMAAELVSRQR